MNLLTGVIVGLVAIAAALIVVLLLMDRGRSQSPGAYRRARRNEVAHQRALRARDQGADGRGRPGEPGDEMRHFYDNM